jgi:hypothetical protein
MNVQKADDRVIRGAGKKDGLQRVWLNGALVLDRSGVLWREGGGQGVARFTFRNFMGGSDTDWAAPHDQDVVR